MKPLSSASAITASLLLLGCSAAIGADDAGEAAEITAQPEVLDLSVDQLQLLIAEGNVRLIDVRRYDEVALGVVPGAEHVALDKFDPSKLDLSDGREVVLYCRSGRRSGIAGTALAQHLGKSTKHLAGGIIAWREAGNETVIPE